MTERATRSRKAASKAAWNLEPEPEVEVKPEVEVDAVSDPAPEPANPPATTGEVGNSPPPAPPLPPAAWLAKAKAAKTKPKPEWNSELAEVSAPAASAVSDTHSPPIVSLATRAAPAREMDFETRVAAALEAADKGGDIAAFGGGSRVANSPLGGAPREGTLKEEARRQGVTVAQLMHARAHADTSPLTKVRF